MDKSINAICFPSDICDLFAELLQKDMLNVKILFFIGQCQQKHRHVSIKYITENVYDERRVAIKNSQKKLVSFKSTNTLIDRKAAEKIVDRLVHASLIHVEVEWPYKYLKLTARGLQVAQVIKEKMGDKRND